jgi:5-methylthioribose kinase
VERYYNGLYPFIIFFRTIFGIIPFSVGDLIYFIFLIFFIKNGVGLKKNLKQDWKNNALHILSFASIFYFVFHLLWAMNYQPLLKKWKSKDYSDEELLHFTKN